MPEASSPGPVVASALPKGNSKEGHGWWGRSQRNLSLSPYHAVCHKGMFLL